MTGCSPTRLYCSLWHSQRNALKPCPRIHSPFFSLPSSLPLFHKSTHHFYVLYEHSTPSWHLKTFPHPPKNTPRVHLSKQCAPIWSLFPPQGGHIRPAVSLRLYKCWNIHMHTSLSPSLCWPISKKNIFLHFKVCYIYEGRRCPPCKANTVTHPVVEVTPDATHGAKNLNKTSQRRRDEVCVLRKRNCGCYCRNKSHYCRYLKDLWGRELVSSNLHLFSLEGLMREEKRGGL